MVVSFYLNLQVLSKYLRNVFVHQVLVESLIILFNTALKKLKMFLPKDQLFQGSVENEANDGAMMA